MAHDTAEAGLDRIQACAFAVSEIICLALAVGIVASCLAGQDSATAGGEIVLDEKINPNEAPVESIARLPNVGRVRAQAIVAYRGDYRAKEGISPVFRDRNDLQNVKGIGPKTSQDMSKWLRFE